MPLILVLHLSQNNQLNLPIEVYYVLSFIFFRFFDILKPFPVSYFDKNFKNIPIVGELVEIYEGQAGSFYYRRIGLDENPTKSAFKNALQKVILSE